MDSKQLIDSLADYMARYHSTSMPTSKSQLENIVIRWIRSLPKEQRQVVLTMVNKSSKQKERIGIDIGRMDSQQLIDSLLDHRALYHSASTSASKRAKSQFRNNVIRWIYSLTVEQRQAALTTVDKPWVTILLQMHERIERDGPGFFFLLTDMPMKSEGNLGSEAEALPSLCYRKAKGLLARVQADNEHERVLAEGVRLFSSTEGQFPAAKRPRFDSLMLEEDLVADVVRFVKVMDKISNYEFLRGAGPASGSRWEELPWLRAKGYYSLAAFVANKLELSLRFAWLNSHGKKKTCRVIDRCSSSSFVGNGHDTAKNGVALAAFAASIFSRKKGCVHWWSKVDRHDKAEAFKFAVAKAGKFEVIQLDRNMKDVESNKAISAGKPIAVHKVSSNPRFSHHDSHFKCHSFPSYLCRKESGSCNFLGGLYILQEVSLLTKVPEDDSLFFSSLKSADTISDNIMRRVREVFAKVSKDFVELDLLREENTRNYLNNPKAKSAEVPKKEKRRKGRSKKKKVPMCKQDLQDACPNQILDDTSPDQITCEDQVPMMNNEEDSRKGIISSAIDPGMTKITIKKENIDNLICQEENNMSPCGLLKNLETKQPSSGMGETQVKRNKQGRGRSKLKKKNTANLDATPLSNGKDRKLGDYCEQPQHEVGDIQQGSSLQYSICDQDIDGSGENFCSQSTNFASSLISSTNICTVDKDRTCSAELPVTSSDELGHKGRLSESDFHDKRDANSGSSFEKQCLISVMNSHVLCKPNSLDINDDVARMDSSLKSNISERDKGDANFLSIDCKSTSGSLSLLQDNLDGSLPSTATDLSYPVHQGELNNELKHEDAQCSLKPNTNCFQTCNSNSVEHVGTQETSRYETQQQRRLRNRDHLIRDTANFMPPTSYEWPGSLHFCFPSATCNLLPAATDRLHLDVDWKWQHRSQPTFVPLRQPMVRNSSWQGVYHKRNPKSQAARKGLESSPVVPTGCNLTPPMGYSFEAGFTPFPQRSFQAGCVSSNMELNGHMRMKEDSRYEGTDDSVCDDLKYVSGDTDDFEGYAISEDEGEKFPSENASNNVDYNQVFGGGVMYWNTPDYAGTGYSRPPSLSSEDSSWARHEDDLKLVIEDIVSLPPLPGPYGNGGVTSPPTTFHSTFDHYCPATPTTPGTFVKTGNDFTGNFTPPGGPVSASEEHENRSINKCSIGVVDGIKGEAFSHPILRPIIIPNPSKQRPRNEAHSRESRSPCLPRNRREPTRLKRPPSPVVLCVPPAPPPPPPSPVGGFRNQRRFPNVRSGSSSPRHWGISGWPNEAEIDVDDHHMSPGNPEVVSFGWRRKCITATPTMHSLSAALLRDRLVAIPQLALEQEHPDIALPLQSASIQKNPAIQASVSKLHSLLHDEIESFCKQVAAENLMRKQFVNAALEKVSRALQVLWPRSRTKIFGSIATGLALPTSDVDLVVCLPPVRNLEPIKEAGILEGRNGIKETCLQHAARYLADQEWVKSDSLKTIENTVIPIIMLEVDGLSQHCNKNEDPLTLRTIRDELRNGKEKENMSNTMVPESSLGSACETRKTPWGRKNNRESVRLDISFESRSHTGLKTANLVRELTGRFPAIVPLALVLKQFLTDRSLDHPYSGGLSSYCLVLLITRFLQHEHHAGRAINQNLGGLFMDFLYFFGCVFDPRQMGVSIYGSGMYTNRDRGQSIDPLHIDDPLDNPLHPANNVGRNCFRIHQCTKAFADAHSVFQKELLHLSTITDSNEGGTGKVLPKIIPSIADMYGDKI